GTLISVLTSTPRNPGQFTTVLPVSPKNIEDTIKDYDAPRIRALDSLLDALQEYKFDRALSLLVTGKLPAFFATPPAPPSFAGNLLAATKKVVQDLPAKSPLQGKMSTDVNPANQFVVGTAPDTDFSDANEPMDAV